MSKILIHPDCKFNMGIMIRQELITNRRIIAIRYMKDMFILDLNLWLKQVRRVMKSNNASQSGVGIRHKLHPVTRRVCLSCGDC